MVVWEYPPHVVGGLGTYAGAMAPALRAAGHHVDVFAAIRSGVPPPSPGVYWARPPNLEPTYEGVFDHGAAAWGPFFGELYGTNVLWADAVRRQHTEEPYDLVAIHDWLSAPAGLMLGTELDCPLVFHVHSVERGRQPDAPSPIVSGWENRMAHQAQAVITVSEAMRTDVVAHGWPVERVRMVWNGIDPHTYHPDSPGGPAVRARYGIESDRPVVLFIGRLIAVKGALQLAQAWPAVVARNPEARLIVLGTGELEGDIRGALKAAGVSETVVVRSEFVSEGERIAHYLAADLVVLPSTYEPFGIVGIEAMACGRPAVVGAHGVAGLREQIVPQGRDQSGLHVNGNDPADIAWGLNEALSDRARLSRWGANARRRAETLFTWGQAAEKTAAVYAEVVAASV